MTGTTHGHGTAPEPIFNIPAFVLGSVVVLIVLHLARGAMSPAVEEWWVLSTALIPARYTELDIDIPGTGWARFTTPFTHMLVHGDLTHLAFNTASLLAFGSAIEKRLGGLRYFLIATISGLAGAALFVAVNPGLAAAMIGASGAIAGLMGATMRFLFNALERGGLTKLHRDPHSIPLMPLTVAVRDKRVLISVGSFVLLNLLAFVGWGIPNDFGGIAWEAHIGGFFAGFLLIGLFDVATRNKGERQPILS